MRYRQVLPPRASMRRFALALLSTTLVAATALVPNVRATNAPAASAPAGDAAATARVQALFRDANQFWTHELDAAGGSYKPADLALFDRQIRKVCGQPGPLTGPFYCPDEMKVYLDQSFLQQVGARSSGSLGDFALGYVIGHEMGLHVQDLVGTIDLVEQARENSSPALSARIWKTQELQADCFAGMWLRWAIQHADLQPVADAAAALDAVSAVAQERQAHLAPGETMVDPLLTYGTPAQRLEWFQRGMNTGRFNDCDTFSAEASGKIN
jgi:uncharacterized protein